ncbi:low molecular weight protein-tyrosine-phosphatase [Zhongshania sp.]|jgi:protein-tyrosine phosphatase|uniref:low molecular weight protein-tyrosine-phosphatase n=1 Tax=Zhongshania sp. TaxID=1971902 RepID=UPI002A7FEC8F|nr:low molecular weight protein-tyrosine-phosphatase [Zhongshania sp.]
MPIHVVFVCLGNICRSPAAQGVFEKYVLDAGLADKVSVDSCGTAAFNLGKSPDPRSIAAAGRAGYDITQQIARQIDDHDYQHASYVVAMDRMNLTNVLAWAPADYDGEIKLLMDYCGHNGNSQIPDPYYDDEHSFDRVIQQIEIAAKGLLETIRQAHGI